MPDLSLNMKDYWWIETGVPEDEANSGCVRVSLTKMPFSVVKKGVWRLYRLNLDRPDLNASDKLVLYCLCERYRVQSMSSTDAVGYIGKMCNLSRATVGKSIKRLADVNVIWIVQEGPDRIRHSKLEARKYFKKHFLIVGLSFEVSERG